MLGGCAGSGGASGCFAAASRLAAAGLGLCVVVSLAGFFFLDLDGFLHSSFHCSFPSHFALFLGFVKRYLTRSDAQLFHLQQIVDESELS